MILVFDELIKKTYLKNKHSLNDIDIIVPVPINKHKKRLRGFNQAEILAQVLGNTLSLPVPSANLKKIKKTIPQAGLSKEKRINNLIKAFSIREPLLIKEKHILLVDDVMTTGATLDTCAKELLKAGAKSVTGFTLARTL